MKNCKKCGAAYDDGTRFCPNCGSATDGSAYTVESNSGATNTASDNTALAILSYIGPLCFIPYFGAKDSEFVHYHAVRGLNFFILCVIGYVATRILSIIPLIGWIFYLAYWAVALYLMVMGIINAANGVKKDLPWIGSVRFVKD